VRIPGSTLTYLLVHVDVLPDQIEGDPDMQPDVLICGGVVDRVLTDELKRALLVGLHESDRALRQGHTEAVLFGVGQLDLDHDGAFRAGVAPQPTPRLVGVVDEELARLHARGGEERHLLGLPIRNGRGLAKGVEVVLKEGLLLEPLLHRRSLHHPADHHGFVHRDLFLDRCHVARHQLQPGVGVGGARGVRQRDPALEVQGCVIVVQHCHIVRFPGQPVGDVGDLTRSSAGDLAPELPHEGWLGEESLGEGRETRRARRSEYEGAVPADNAGARRVGGEKGDLVGSDDIA